MYKIVRNKFIDTVDENNGTKRLVNTTYLSIHSDGLILWTPVIDNSRTFHTKLEAEIVKWLISPKSDDCNFDIIEIPAHKTYYILSSKLSENWTVYVGATGIFDIDRTKAKRFKTKFCAWIYSLTHKTKLTITKII